MNIALFQPDMAANVAATIRLATCFAQPVSIIEPTGFVWDRKRLRRVGMDYLETADIRRFSSFCGVRSGDGGEKGGALVLLTTKGANGSPSRLFCKPDDILLGRSGERRRAGRRA